MNPIYNLSPDNLWAFSAELDARRIQIITSCTGTKSVQSESPLVWSDFEKGADWVCDRESRNPTLPAKELYSGRQHMTLLDGMAQRPDLEYDLKIVSAGYGLIDASKLIAPYEATFSGLGKKEIRRRADKINLPFDIRNAIERTTADLTLILLGADYLRACKLQSPVLALCPTFFIGSTYAEEDLQGSNLFQIPLTNADAVALGAGQVWLKSVVANMVLNNLKGGRYAHTG
jgi:hypothetical protein